MVVSRANAVDPVSARAHAAKGRTAAFLVAPESQKRASCCRLGDEQFICQRFREITLWFLVAFWLSSCYQAGLRLQAIKDKGTDALDIR